jgi:hypothetical protein
MSVDDQSADAIQINGAVPRQDGCGESAIHTEADAAGIDGAFDPRFPVTPSRLSTPPISRWRRLRRSPWFPYVLSLVVLIAGIGSQGYQYWWGAQIQRFVETHGGYVKRIEVFPASWKKQIRPVYLEPIEPIEEIRITVSSLNTRRVVRGVGPIPSLVEIPPISPRELRLLLWLPFLKRLFIFGDMNSQNWEQVSKFRQLKSLNVETRPTSGIPSIAKMDRLQELTITVDSFTPAADFRGIAAMPGLRTLRLNFSGTNRPETVVEQMRELARSGSLTRLEIPSPNDAILLALTEKLPDRQSPLVKLAELRLGNSHESRVTNDGLVNLKNVPNLVHLDLSHSQVTDAGLKSLQSISTLRTLYLAGCRGITNEGADALSRMTGLQSLNVADTALTEAGLLKLSSLRRLRSLRISYHIRVSPELRRAIPATCKFINR